jgi:hypothetical protein
VPEIEGRRHVNCAAIRLNLLASSRPPLVLVENRNAPDLAEGGVKESGRFVAKIPKKSAKGKESVSTACIKPSEPVPNTSSQTTPQDVATIRALRQVCFDALVGSDTVSPIARAFYEALSAMTGQALWGIDCERGSSASQRAYVPHVVRVLQDVREKLFNLSADVASQYTVAQVTRARELLAEAKKDVNAGKPIAVVVAGVMRHETPDRPNSIEASAKAWTDAIQHWEGVSVRMSGRPDRHWSVVVYKLLNPNASRPKVLKGAEKLRQNYKSRLGKKKTPSRH